MLGRRADGYHELETLYLFIDLQDELRFEVDNSGLIACMTPIAGVAADDDLVYRAALALRLAAGRPELGVRYALRKRIPIGAGLGGGSSDAATALVVLNRLWQLDWPLERLAELGLSLGADVPVFVHGQAAYARGVGELLTPLVRPERALTLFVAAILVSTAKVFADPELTRQGAALTIRGLLDGAEGRNDCLAVSLKLHPELAALHQALLAYGPVQMSGTGCTLYMAREAAAQVPAALCERLGVQRFEVRTLNRSPLHALLAATE